MQTAQKRTNGFVLGSYDFTPNLKGYVNAFYNRTESSGQDAPSPVGTGDGLIISSSNPINPFGVTFSQDPVPGDPNSDYNFQTRSEEHTSELQSLMRISYAVFCLKNKIKNVTIEHKTIEHTF